MNPIRILLTVLSLAAVVAAWPLSGLATAPAAASPGISAGAYNEPAIYQSSGDTTENLVEAVAVTLTDEDYHVEFTEYDLKNAIKAVVKLPNGEKISYGSTWKGFVPDQVLANAIGRKHRVAQAVATAAGGVHRVPVEIEEIKASPDKPLDSVVKPAEKPGAVPSNSAGDGGGAGDSVSGTSGATNTVSSSSAPVTSGSGTVSASSSSAAPAVSLASNSGPGSLNTGPGNVQIRFTAKVNGTGTNMWMIGLTPVSIDANTKMLDNPTFGAMVEVRGFQQPGTIALATQIRNLSGSGSGGGTPVRFTATVEDIASTSWLVGGFTVTIDASTRITGVPQEGSIAEVRAVRQTGTTLVATDIRILDASGSGSSATSGSGDSISGSGSGSSGSGSSGSGSSGSGSSGSGSSGSGSGSSGSGSSGSGSGSSGSGSEGDDDSSGQGRGRGRGGDD